MTAAALLSLLAACNADYGGLTRRAPPSVSVSAPGPYYEGATIDVQGTVSVAYGASLGSCEWTWGLPDGAESEACGEADGVGVLRWSWTPESTGEALVTLTATDDGDQTGTASVSFEVLADEAPSATIYVPEEGATLYEDDVVTLVGVVFDRETDDLSTLVATWTLGEGSPETAPVLGTGETGWEGALAAGEWTATLSVTAGAATATDMVTFQVRACDADGDGFDAEGCGGADCDDENIGDYPGTSYYDADGDGLGDPASPYFGCDSLPGYVSNPDDCDDTDAAAPSTLYADADGDGHGDPDLAVEGCATAGFVAVDDDCDDGDETVSPSAVERCNGVDDDCDGDLDEADAADVSTWYADDDGDGFGSSSTLACDAPSGHVATDGDCDDADATAYPGATETCDGADDDCDGSIDENDAADVTTWYLDADGDGYGDDDTTEVACDQPASYIASAGDCDDLDGDVHPYADESDCTDPTDLNCDGSVGFSDADGDGTPACEDCDDNDAASRPDASETCDGSDNDCDGTVDEDYDADADGLADCFDSEDCDGLDNDGDGTTDEGFDADGDGTADCFDSELCDGVDNDGDGAVDENTAADAPTWYEDGDADGYGDVSTIACEAPTGYVAAGDDCDDDDDDVNPGAVETCDGVDEDCDGDTDEDASDADTFYADADGDGLGDAMVILLACTQPSAYVDKGTDCDDADASVGAAATWYRDADGDGFGGASSTTSCDQPSGYVATADDCDDTDSDVYPGTEETTWYVDADGDGHGDATAASSACEQPSGFAADGDDCDDTDSDVSPSATEACNGEDDDCDGATDEDWGDSDADGTLDCADSEACDGLDNDGDGDVDESFDDADGDGTADCVDTEECDGLDNDGDGTTDESSANDALDWYLDADGDGYGSGSALVACDEPAGYADNAEDCDDDDDTVYPSADEACDGRDNDCDGALASDEVDADGDGSYACSGEGDCDDGDAAIHPDADEVCDGEDNNCNGEVGTGELVDSDGDGADACQCAYFADEAACEAAADCDDTDATVYPGAPDECDGLDNDCDSSTVESGEQDVDGDGYVACDPDECDDNDASRNPDAEETWDGVDEDCDGEVDDQIAYSRGDFCVTGEAVGDVLESAPGSDLDGDSLADLVLSAPCYDPSSALTTAGAAAIFRGSASGFLGGATEATMLDADVVILGDAYNGGMSVMPAGDVDGDGVDDLSLWSDRHLYYFTDIATLSGSLSVSAADDYLDYAYSGSSTSWIGGGDWDGDGAAEAILNAAASSLTLVFDSGGFGSFAGIDLDTYGQITTNADLTVEFTGRQYDQVMLKGDLDGNGYGDLVAPCRYCDEGAGTSSGAVYIFLSDGAWPTSALGTADADVVLTGAAAGDALGYNIEQAADVDRDGDSELLLHAHEASSYAGQLVIVPGPLSRGESIATDVGLAITPSASSNYGFGECLASADLDGDGLTDVGACRGIYDSTAWLFLGADLTLTAGSEVNPDEVRAATFDVGTFNATLTSIVMDDADGDGTGELVMGGWGGGGVSTSEGEACVFYGKNGP